MATWSRFREMGGFTDLNTVYVDKNVGCVANATQTTSYLACGVGKRTRTYDTLVPNFRKLRAEGKIFNNYFLTERLSRINSITGPSFFNPSSCGGTGLLSYERQGPQLTKLLTDQGRGSIDPPPSLITADERARLIGLASTKVWSDLASADEQLLVFLAEFKQTWQMLRHPLENLHKFFTSVRKKKNRNSRSQAISLGNYLSNEWLTYRFGVRPLLSDLNNTVRALGRRTGTVRKTSRNNQSSSQDLTEDPVVITHGLLTTTYRNTHKHDLNIRAGCIWEAEMLVTDFLGVNLSNLPSTAWELIPFSFVVDWLGNVSDYIQAWTPHPLTRVLASWLTTEDNMSTEQRVLGSAVVPGQEAFAQITTQSAGVDSCEKYVKERQPSLPLPSLQSKVNWDLAVKAVKDHRIIDSAALLLQRLRLK